MPEHFDVRCSARCRLKLRLSRTEKISCVSVRIKVGLGRLVNMDTWRHPDVLNGSSGTTLF